jgi:hypothetical protein
MPLPKLIFSIGSLVLSGCRNQPTVPADGNPALRPPRGRAHVGPLTAAAGSSSRFVMRELEFRTSRVRRGWLDRLKGYDRLYETKITDGERVAYGRGPSREASEQAAQRNWTAKFHDLDNNRP